MCGPWQNGRSRKAHADYEKERISARRALLQCTDQSPSVFDTVDDCLWIWTIGLLQTERHETSDKVLRRNETVWHSSSQNHIQYAHPGICPLRSCGGRRKNAQGHHQVWSYKDVHLDSKRLHPPLSQGCRPDVWSYTALMKGYTKRKQIDEALRLLGDFQSQGGKPNEVTYFVRGKILTILSVGNIRCVDGCLCGGRETGYGP